MPTVPTRWELPSPPTPEIRARFSWLHPVILQALFNRGLVDSDEVAEFFGQHVRSDDPFRMKGIPETVERLRWAIRKGEAIAVYGDFDADGVTSTALMVQTLEALGADVMPYIPHRVDEGYGLNNEALAWLRRQDVQIVLTVDCGIRAVKEVRFGRELGLDLLVTDHHSIGPELPNALTVVNPKQGKYGFDTFAGVGVAFKIAQALLRVEQETPVARRPVQLEETDLLDLVAIGTVADMMPLRGENRTLVQRGLKQLNDDPRPGLRALIRSARTHLGEIDATAIGFRLAPRLNAAGRLRSAVLAYDLLQAPDDDAASGIAEELNRLNRERQRLTQEAMDFALAELGEAPPDPVLFIGRDDFNPGIVGLVASRLKEVYYRPALVAELGAENIRGSARSVPEFNITAALDQCADLLVRYGGHAAAAGFTVSPANLTRLRRKMNEIAAAQLDPQDRVHKLPIDAIVDLIDLDHALLAKLKELEPTGAGNPPVVLAIPDLMVRAYRRVGDKGQHLKLRLSDGHTTIDAIAFNQGYQATDLPLRVDVACEFEENVWQNRRTLQLHVHDLKPAGRAISQHEGSSPSVSPLFGA